MLALILAAAVTTAAPDARHASLLVMMQREGVCGDAPEAVCAQAARRAEIQPLGSIRGASIALVSFEFDNAICGNVNCPYLVVAFQRGDARKVLWADGYAVTVGRESPLPSLRVTSHDSADTNYISRYEWRSGRYVRVEYLRERLDTGETRPASIPVAFARGASSATVHGSVTHYWSETFDVVARSGQRLVVSNIRSADPLQIMLDGPDGLPLVVNVAAGTPYLLSSSGTYQLTVYLDTVKGSDRDRPFALTVTIR